MRSTLPVLLLFGLTVPAWTQTPDRLTEPIQNYSLQANSFIDGLLKVSARFQLPLGVEWVKTADTLKPVRLSRSNTTVADVIQAMVSMNAGYDWRMEDGIVHVFQRDLANDSRNPLNITIEKFDEHPEIVVWANISLDIMVSHVVRHPDTTQFDGSVLGNPDDPVFNFAAQNVPARSILNKIVTAGLAAPSPRMKRVWVATFPGKPLFSRTGFLEVVPMVNPKFISEHPSEPPFWELLSWGDPPLENMVR